MERLHCRINDIKNQNMKTQLKNTLEKVEGVNQVCVDVSRGSLEVIYSEPATQEGIRNTIEEAGHKIE